MNSIVGHIFNESFVKKKVCESCEQCMEPTKKPPQPHNVLLKKKKKNADADVII